MISVRQKGDFRKVNTYFEKLKGIIHLSILDKYGKKGVAALSSSTPTKTGKTASSWTYEIERSNGESSLIFKNTNINNGVPIAIILFYGHGTKNGGYVQGIDYINPALKPVFDQLADEAWEEVKKL